MTGDRFLVVASNRTWLIVDTGLPDARSIAAVFDKERAYDLAAILSDTDDLGPSFDLSPEPFA